MAALIELYLKESQLKSLIAAAQGKPGVSITVSVNDTANNYNQNAAAFVSQTKEQREAQEKKVYVANGRVVWTDNKIEALPYKAPEQQQQAAPATDDFDTQLPF